MNVHDIAVRVDAGKEQLTKGEQFTANGETRRRELAGIVAHLVEILQGISPSDMRVEGAGLNADLRSSDQAFSQAHEHFSEAARGSEHPLLSDAVTYAGSAREVIGGEEAGATAEIPVLTKQLNEFAGDLDALLMSARALETTLGVLQPPIERAQELAQQADFAAGQYREGLGAE